MLPTTVAAAKYYATIGLSILIVILSWIDFARDRKQFPIIPLTLLYIATALAALTFVASLYTTNLWLTMKQKPDL